MGWIQPYESAHGRRYSVRYRRPDHTEAQKRGFRTLRDAELYLATVTVSKSTGDFVDTRFSKLPVGAFVDAWLRSKRPPMLKPSSFAAVELSWRRYVAPVWADREIGSISRSEVQTWVAELASRRSRTVVLRALGTLAGILDIAVDDHLLRENPARHIRNLPRVGPGKRRVYLTHDQVWTLAAHSIHPDLVLVLAY